MNQLKINDRKAKRLRSDADAPRRGASEAFLESLLAVFPEDLPRFTAICRGLENGAGLVECTVTHGVAALLAGPLRAVDHPTIASQLADLDRVATLQRMLQRRLRSHLDDVLGALAEQGIAAVPLKGPILGERLYGDQALRVSTDLDVLVSAAPLNEVVDTVRRLGYALAEPSGSPGGQKHPHHLSCVRPDGTLLELHFRLLGNFGTNVAAEEFIARAEVYRAPGGAEYRVLSAEDELIYLLAHAAVHLFERLAWLYDVKALLRLTSGRLNLGAAAERAERLGLGPVFAFAAGIIEERLHVNLAASELSAGRQALRARAARALLTHARAARERGRASPVRDHMFRAALCAGPGTSLRYLVAQAIRVLSRPRDRG
jgi:hypothetical protein